MPRNVKEGKDEWFSFMSNLQPCVDVRSRPDWTIRCKASMLGSFIKDENYTLIKYLFNLLCWSPSDPCRSGRQTTSGGFKDLASYSFLHIILRRQHESTPPEEGQFLSSACDFILSYTSKHDFYLLCLLSPACLLPSAKYRLNSSCL